MNDKPDVISRIYTLASGQQVITLTDGTALELSTMDVEMLSGAFPGECEACGYDPNEDDVDITDDGEEDADVEGDGD